MTAGERLRIEVIDAMDKAPSDTVAETVVSFVAVVAAATEVAYCRLRDLGLDDRRASGVLGLPPAFLPAPLGFD